MTRRVFINGMGRIGRAVLKQLYKDGNYVIAGINDINMNAIQMSYLLKYDSTGQGTAAITDLINVDYEDETTLVINGVAIPIYAYSDISSLPLGDLGVEAVFDCTGVAFDKIDYLNAGTEKVIMCFPTSDKSIPTVVYGVNHKDIDAASQVYSIGSCSTQAAAILLNTVHKNAGVVGAFVKVVRSYTNDQAIMDNANGNNYERGRAAAVNIVPTSTSAGKLIGTVIPKLSRLVLGQAFRTPTILGGAVDITIQTDKVYTATEINSIMESDVDNEIWSCTDEYLVSSDVIGSNKAVTFLTKHTLSLGNGLINIVGIYDNENGFAAQAVRTLNYIYSI